MGAQPLSERLCCHWGNEAKWIQTTGNAAKASGSESSGACGFHNRSLSAEIGSRFPCVFCHSGWLLLAGKKLTQHRPTCCSAFGYTSLVPPKGPRHHPPRVRSWPGIFQSPLSLVRGPFLTLAPVPVCSKLLPWELVRNTRELLLSVERISSAQRTSAVPGKLKRSCAKTLGVQNRCPAGKREGEIVVLYQVHTYLSWALTRLYRQALMLL